MSFGVRVVIPIRYPGSVSQSRYNYLLCLPFLHLALHKSLSCLCRRLLILLLLIFHLLLHLIFFQLHLYQQQWQLLSQSPVSYYIVSSQSPARIKPLLEQYLASIPRQNVRNRQLIPSEGANLQRAAIGDAMRTDIHAWSWQPFYNWTPDTSEHIPLLVNLANARLKEALRGQAMGVYSLKFRSLPQPMLNRVENELVFNTEPARAEELWRIAQQVLEKCPIS